MQSREVPDLRQDHLVRLRTARRPGQGAASRRTTGVPGTPRPPREGAACSAGSSVGPDRIAPRRGAQMKSSWAPSVFSMKSEALMMPSTSS